MRISTLFLIGFLVAANPWKAFGQAEPECRPLEEQPIKIEVWLSKRYEKNWRPVAQDFSIMDDVRVTLWFYPAENPSGTVAIGSCVPVYIAQYAIRKALKYTVGVNSLVFQGFISPHWIGMGTNLFAELARQPASAEQVEQLLDEDLTSGEFQALYRKFTAQDETTTIGGVDVPNPKRMTDPPRTGPNAYTRGP